MKAAASFNDQREFWEEAHATDDLLMLSGYDGPNIWRRLKIEDRVVPGANVLNIGVGLALCERDLHERGCIVSSLDTSWTALQRVSAFATIWHETALDRLPRQTYDLVMCHLVWQHMLDEQLVRQIAGVVPALKPDGVFAAQFLGPAPVPLDRPYTMHDAMAGGVSRSADEVAALVEQAGGKVNLLTESDSGPDWLWMIVHIHGR